ncbi:hypothetical protein [Kineococcus sp. SYSU DK002]|uniref:hypothetical protein n=1 Tax=Kineococcus sp. SYSU DK002 TaxID=3383123 RepID=UPI003D7CFB3F
MLRACRESAGLHERCAALYEQIALRAADDQLDRFVGLAALERSRAAADRERARRLASVLDPAPEPAVKPAVEP